MMRAGRAATAALAVAALALVVAAADSAVGDNAPTSVDGHELPTWFHIVFGIVCIVVGLVEIAVGYRIFSITCFCLGFLTTSVAIFLAIFDHWSASYAVWVALAVAALVGLTVGIIAAKIPKIGVFLAGAALGVVSGIVLTTMFLYKIVPANPTIILGVSSSLLGIIFGIVALRLMRPLVITATSVVRACRRAPLHPPLPRCVLSHPSPILFHAPPSRWAPSSSFTASARMCQTPTDSPMSSTSRTSSSGE